MGANLRGRNSRKSVENLRKKLGSSKGHNPLHHKWHPETSCKKGGLAVYSGKGERDS